MAILPCPVEAARQPPQAASSVSMSDTRWSVPLPAAPLAAALVADGRVFLTLASGLVLALRTADGAEAWRAALTAEQPPAALDGLLFVPAGGAIHALRAADGSVAWRAATGAVTAPLLAMDGWLIASSGTGLMALRAADGTVVWQREIGAEMLQPSIEGDRLYLSRADGRVQSLVLPTGADRWSRRLGGAPTEVLAFADQVFVGAADRYFYSLDAGNGAIAWRSRIGAALRGRPAAAGSLVFAAALDNLVRAFDRDDGARKWGEGAPYRPIAGPLVVGSAIVLSGPGGTLPTFDAVSGTRGTPLTLPGTLAAPLAAATVDGGPVLVTVTGDAAVGWTVSLLGPRFGLAVIPLTALPGEVLPIPVPPIRPQ